MGARGCLGQAVYDEAESGTAFFAVSADLGIASGFGRFMSRYGSRYINTGIAEQNLAGVAAGMADDNTPVIATSWAAFATYRCADQIRNYMGLMGANIKLTGMDSGLTISRFGGCHYATGDIALMLGIPGITIIAPCDGIEIYRAVHEALRWPGPVYIRLTGGERRPVIHKRDDYVFRIGKAGILCEGDDVVIIACGVIISECLKAVRILEEAGIRSTLVNMSTIRPLDVEAIRSRTDCRLMVTVEEHNISGGLGAAVAQVLAGMKKRPPQLMCGIADFIPQTGTYEFVLDQCGLSGEAIATKVKQEMERMEI